MLSRSQKRLSSSSEAGPWSELPRLTAVEFTRAPDRFTLKTQPKIEGISTRNSERRIGELSFITFQYEWPPMWISTGKSYFYVCFRIGQPYSMATCHVSDLLRDSRLRRKRVRALKCADWDGII
jgi:hypothetical protein